MLAPLIALAMRSPARQQAFRRAAVLHLLVLAGGAWVLHLHGHGKGPAIFGQLLLVAGIIEGAVLVGWRLTQVPRSQSLEFLLVTPVSSARLFGAEALAGLARLALVTLAGLPVLVVLTLLPGAGRSGSGPLLGHIDVLVLLGMPVTWGAVTGLGLTAWAYEPRGLRRWAERLVLAGIAVYLAVGLMAGENLKQWLDGVPGGLGRPILQGFKAFHLYSPFAVMQGWFTATRGLDGKPWLPWERTAGLELVTLAALVVLHVRAAGRLKGHFHERHYQPAADGAGRRRDKVGERPLSWWAVRRVTEYSGRINLWLAAGFAGLYAAHTLAGGHWPAWLGRQVFVVFDQVGGIPVVSTALVVLAAVPAAFQYGLWDSNAHSRCRRLELLLLTQLQARDYWEAATAAAWKRGRGYFGLSLLLWGAAVLAGKAGIFQLAGALAAGTLLWCCYFAVGFRAFSRGLQANGLGALLTLGLPLLTYLLHWAGTPLLAALLPPGSVYAPFGATSSLTWALGPAAAGLGTLALARSAMAHGDKELRRWYEQYHGRHGMD